MSKTQEEANAVSLYRLAFAKYGVRALWNLRQLEAPNRNHILATARQLRIEGDLAARQLAEDMEKAARADHALAVEHPEGDLGDEKS